TGRTGGSPGPTGSGSVRAWQTSYRVESLEARGRLGARDVDRRRVGDGAVGDSAHLAGTPVEQALQKRLEAHRARDQVEADGKVAGRRRQAVAGTFFGDREAAVNRGLEAGLVQQPAEIRTIVVAGSEGARVEIGPVGIGDGDQQPPTRSQ